MSAPVTNAEEPGVPLRQRLLAALSPNRSALLDARSSVAAASVVQSDALTTLLSGLGLSLILSAIATGSLAVNAVAQERLASCAYYDRALDRSAFTAYMFFARVGLPHF